MRLLLMISAALIVMCLSNPHGVGAEPAVERSAVYTGHTAPSEKREQSFDARGVVKELLVKEGDQVKAGQLLARQETEEDEVHLKSLELVANSDLASQAEAAQTEKDRVDLKRKAELFRKSAISPAELDEAKVTVVIDELKTSKAKEDQQKAKYEVAEQKAKLDEKKLYARIDGVISQISTREGELANSDSQHPALTIVKNDPLYVEVDLPAAIARRLQRQDELEVQYVDEGDAGKWRAARVHFIKPEADAQSNYQHVQLEMPNPQQRSSGLQVKIRLAGSLAAAP